MSGYRRDLEPERTALEALNDGVELCGRLGDAGSPELLEHILKNQEERTNYLQAQLPLIGQVGKAHYLAQQITHEDD